MKLCSRCNIRPAVVFITRVEGEKSTPEGLCLTCAKELGIKPINDMIDSLNIPQEDLEAMTAEIMSLMPGGDNEDKLDKEDFEDFEPGGAATFPFLQNLFGKDKLNAAEGDNAKTTDQQQAEKPKKKDKSPKRKYLDGYCTNLTGKAKAGKLDRIIGRDKELYRVIQILSRRSKNNPCLIGEPGVGKTAIAEGLALKIVNGDVPARLLKKEIHLLDLTALVAGTQFRGQFESRVKGLVDEVKAEGNIILFIDEIHNLVGTGDSEGTMNAANILKPSLSRGEIQVIGATTFNEYRKYIEKDAALERRFQPVTVEEPSIEDTITVLTGVKDYYEEHHRVSVSANIIYQAVTLSERYITDRFLPDKAIDLLDEACACASLRNKAADDFEKMNNALEELTLKEQELEAETETIDYESLAMVKSDIAKKQEELQKINPADLHNDVTFDDIARVIELWTGIPATKIRESDLKKLGLLEENLYKKIIGQDEAIKLVSAAVRRSRVQINPRRRPASFIFVGPTGVGKTELVKVLANELFSTPETLIRLDMSEFMEKHSVSRIIGSPPGYVGYDEAGQLTEKVRRKAYSVLLFDEIEKAHPDVLNILLQILEDGQVTDAHGRKVNFENTIIIMTSNAGSEKRDNLLGFGKSGIQASNEKAIKALEELLRPEFIGRVDEIVVFKPLDEDDYKKVAGLMLDELVEPLKTKGIEFSYSADVTDYLAKKAILQKRGARDLRNIIRREVEDLITTILVDKCDDTPEKIKIKLKNDTIIVE